MNQKTKIFLILGSLILVSFIIIITIRYAYAWTPGNGTGGGDTVAYCQGAPNPVIAGKGSTVIWTDNGSKAQWNQSGSGTNANYAQAQWMGVCNTTALNKRGKPVPATVPAAGPGGFHVPNCQQADDAMRMNKNEEKNGKPGGYKEQLIITDANGHMSNNVHVFPFPNDPKGICYVKTSNPLTISIPACPIPAPGPAIDKKTGKKVVHYTGEITLPNCPKDYTFSQNSQDAGLPGPWTVTYTWDPGCLEDKQGSQYYDPKHKAACTAPAKAGICPCTITVDNGSRVEVKIKDTTEPKWTENYICYVKCPSPSPSPSPSPQP